MTLPTRRRSIDAARRERTARCRLQLHATSCAAGDLVSGTVVGLGAGASVSLLRAERHLDDYRVFKASEARAQPCGAFELPVPWGALPSTRGKHCALEYVVRARSPDATVYADLAVVATAQPHVDVSPWRADRLLANWDARHFHIELAEARLEGGGRLAGRVHRHRRWAAGSIVVQARCVECWRVTALVSRSVPQWNACPLWDDAQPLSVDPAATWAPFAFDLPDGLPQAVEAATIAWRYELVARREVPHWFSETAAVTPLLHEPSSSAFIPARGDTSTFAGQTDELAAWLGSAPDPASRSAA